MSKPGINAIFAALKINWMLVSSEKLLIVRCSVFVHCDSEVLNAELNPIVSEPDVPLMISRVACFSGLARTASWLVSAVAS